MSNGFETPLHIPLRADRKLAWTNHVAHLATGLVLGFGPLPLWLLPLVVLGVVASHRHCDAIHVRRTHATAITLLTLEADGSWTLYRRAGQPLRNARLNSYFCCRDWIIADYVCNDGDDKAGRSVVVTRDTTHADAFRRLKIRLLYQL